MAVTEPQSAGDYDARTTAAVKSVLIEIAQILGSFKGKFAVIGGAVPWLLLREADMPHSGTLDVDLGLDPSALADGEYVRLVETLQAHGYHQRDNLKRFQLVRIVPARDGGPDIDIVVDFLMPRDAEIAKNRTSDQRASKSSWRAPTRSGIGPWISGSRTPSGRLTLG